MRISIAIAGWAVFALAAWDSAQSSTKDDAPIQVGAFSLPQSSLLDARTYAYLVYFHANEKRIHQELHPCPDLETAKLVDVPAIRQCLKEAFRNSTDVSKYLAHYPVDVVAMRVGGVPAEIFTPKDGVRAELRDKVLINLHGGHFIDGSGTNSHLESAPIAAVSRYKVVSVDYRMAPEHSFPAASDDVAAVYRALLKTYKPQNIGIFGCSAGGLLTAQSVARFEKDGLPLPGAIGIFGSGAIYYQEGDSAQIISSIEGWALQPSSLHPYLKTASQDDALAYPARSSDVIKRFPPTLLISSSRDLALSAAVFTHTKLLENGVEADLRVWEGLGHCFAFGSGVPESDAAHKVISQFFDRHLGHAK